MSADSITKGAVRALTSAAWPRNLRWSIGNDDPQDSNVSAIVTIRVRVLDRVLRPDAPPIERQIECTKYVDPAAVPDDMAEGYGFALAHWCVLDIVDQLG